MIFERVKSVFEGKFKGQGKKPLGWLRLSSLDTKIILFVGEPVPRRVLMPKLGFGYQYCRYSQNLNQQHLQLVVYNTGRRTQIMNRGKKKTSVPVCASFVALQLRTVRLHRCFSKRNQTNNAGSWRGGISEMGFDNACGSAMSGLLWL